ncbi:MAG: glycosyltransferase family 2 protein [Terriglobia bacterium]
MKIAATIITLNEEQNLRRCLASLQDVVDEIVVVDSGSRDRTVELAKSYGARVLLRSWTNYSEQKNFAANEATTAWILSLDADECLSPELRDEIVALKSSEVRADAYSFPRKAFYLGKWIEHSGWYPDPKIRLYRKEKGNWEGGYVHETLRIDGKVVALKRDLLHFTCDSLSEHLLRMDRYTTLAAQDLHSRGKRSSFSRMILSPVLTVLKLYLLKAGFRDGFQGIVIAGFAAYYNFVKFAKLGDLERRTTPNAAVAKQR